MSTGQYYGEVILMLHFKKFAKVNTSQTSGVEREPLVK